MRFIAEKENKYIAYYTLRPRKGSGYSVSALNGQQAIAKANHLFGKIRVMLCIKPVADQHNV